MGENFGGAAGVLGSIVEVMSDVPYTNDLETLQEWVGRSETVVERVSAQWCQKLENTLGRESVLADGDALPPLWHFIMHLGSVPMAGIGSDGHPKRGRFLPPVALPRRMWAGGRFTFDGQICLGDEVTKTSTIDKIEMKTGRSGSLCFVTVKHDLSVGGELRISEEQDLVYREDPDPAASKPQPKPAPTDADFSQVVTPSEVMLFRYSALTFNSHRIHYDRTYAREVEGYEALVFQGPLTATLLADLATAETGQPIGAFSFRGMSPLFDSDPFTISGKRDGDSVELWATAPGGGLAMQAHAELATLES